MGLIVCGSSLCKAGGMYQSCFLPLVQERSGSLDVSADGGARQLQGLSGGRGNPAGPSASNDTQGSGGPSGEL